MGKKVWSYHLFKFKQFFELKQIFGLKRFLTFLSNLIVLDLTITNLTVINLTTKLISTIMFSFTIIDNLNSTFSGSCGRFNTP